MNKSGNPSQEKCEFSSKINQEQERVDTILDKYASIQGALIPVLQEVQQLYNYLPEEVLEYIAGRMQIPVAEIYGVATFYSQFHLKPRGRNIIRVCQGTACHVRGGKTVLQTLEKQLGVKAGHTTADLRYTLETVACIGACGLASVMQVNDDTYGRLTMDRLAVILARYE